MANDPQKLLDAIRAELTDPESVALAARTAIALVGLQARAATGEDVSEQMKDVQAIVANLDEHARGVVGKHVMAWTQGLLAKALGVAIAGV